MGQGQIGIAAVKMPVTQIGESPCTEIHKRACAPFDAWLLPVAVYLGPDSVTHCCSGSSWTVLAAI